MLTQFSRILLISLFWLISTAVLAAQNPHNPQHYFTLLNWNAWNLGVSNDYPFDGIRSQLLAAKPDIVTLQEVRNCSSQKGFYALLQPDQYFNFNNMWCASSPSYPGSGEGSAGSYGIAMASLFPTASDKYFREMNGRTIMGTKYQIMGQPVWIWSAHTAFKSTHGDYKRRGDIQTVVNFINSKVQPDDIIILTGDFNANLDNIRANYGSDPEEGDLTPLFNYGFVDAFRTVYPNANRYPLLTYTGSRIDFVFTKNLPDDWRMGNTQVLKNPWCAIGKNDKGQNNGCSANQIVDHNPMLLRVYKDTSLTALDLVENNQLNERLRMTGDGIFYRQQQVFQSQIAGNDDALVSTDLTDNQTIKMETRVARGGTIAFWWKVSSEPEHDRLEFYIDGQRQTMISGERDWQKQEFNIPLIDGKNEATLTWQYTKNEQNSLGQDSAWIDALSYQHPDNSSLPSTTKAALAAIDSKAKKLSAGSINDGFFLTDFHGFGSDAGLQSKALNNNERGKIEFIANGAGSLLFRAKTSTQAISGNQGDALNIYVNGALRKQISGMRSWAQYEITITEPGDHTIVFEYQKDSSITSGDDAVWIDDLNFAPYVKIQDKYAGQASSHVLYWTGYGNDCEAAGYSDCKNLMLINSNQNPGSAAASYWKLIPTPYDDVFYIEEFWNVNSSHGGRMYWTSGGNDCQKAGYSNCKNLMLNSLKDATLGRQALWYFRWDDNRQGYAIEDREGCYSNQTCGANANVTARRMAWTGGGNDCQKGYQQCKNMMLIDKNTNPGVYDLSIWQLNPM